MSARGRRQAVQTAEPLRLFAIVHNNATAAPGGWHAANVVGPSVGAIEAVHAFTSEDDAWRFLLGGYPNDAAHERAMRSAWTVIPLFSVPPAPPERATPWGEGQHDHVQLSAGVSAALRITDDGRVKLTIPGGELDVTDGGTTLGLGLCEAAARAAQIRVARLERARRRGAQPLCVRCGQSLFGYVDHAGQPSYPQCPKRENGLKLCVPAEVAPLPRAPRRRRSGQLDHLPRRSRR